MKDLIKQYGKLFVITFAIGALLPSGFAGYVQANTAGENIFAQLDAKTSSQELFILFHEQANIIVNEKLALLNKGEGYTVDYVPAADCKPNNVSTFCLGVELSLLLMDLESVMVEKRERIDTSEKALTLEEGIEQYSKERAGVGEELELISESIELTLSVYNQAMTVYPMHVELVELINNLEEYRNQLAVLRGIAEGYPSKFHDATMIQCQ